MNSGIICIVLSVIVFISALFSGEANVFQQQVAYSMYICSAILFVGGFVLLKLNKIIEKLNFLDKNNPQSIRINGLKEKYESSSDEDEKRSIAYELVELGETSYKKYLK
jgi:hypothetical protein